METMKLQGVELILSQPTRMEQLWVGNSEVKRQLEAAWLILSNRDLPMNPRVIGKPGIGKTTLAYAVAREYSDQVYIFQCTVDTRPEDLLVTPVIGAEQQIRYHASPLVTAMLKGGVCILDEGNRMGEKSWASLAPLLDTRRYAESIVAGVKIPAHPEFRLAVTMNEDASTFDVPDYIQSRLQPQIEVGFPSEEEELEILKVNLPDAPADVLKLVSEFLQRGHEENKAYTTRDGINISRYAVKLIHLNQSSHAQAVEQALGQVLDEAAHAFFVENCLGPPESVLRPLEILLLGSTDRLDLSARARASTGIEPDDYDDADRDTEPDDDFLPSGFDSLLEVSFEFEEGEELAEDIASPADPASAPQAAAETPAAPPVDTQADATQAGSSNAPPAADPPEPPGDTSAGEPGKEG